LIEVPSQYFDLLGVPSVTLFETKLKWPIDFGPNHMYQKDI